MGVVAAYNIRARPKWGQTEESEHRQISSRRSRSAGAGKPAGNEGQQACLRAEELRAAFEAVRYFTAQRVSNAWGREPTDEEWAAEWAKLIVDFARQLREKGELVSCPPERLLAHGIRGKEYALEIMARAAEGNETEVTNLIVKLLPTPYLKNEVNEWLRRDLRDEIMGHKTLAMQGDDGKWRPVRQEGETDEQWREALAKAGEKIEEEVPAWADGDLQTPGEIRDFCQKLRTRLYQDQLALTHCAEPCGQALASNAESRRSGAETARFREVQVC